MKYQANPQFLLKEVAGDHVLLARGTMAINFGAVVVFNATGLLLWNALAEPHTVEELAEVLVKEYAITAEQAQQDAETFVKKSLDEGILLVTEG